MTPKQRPIVAAFYYPGYHANPHRQIRAGNGSEWPLLYDELAFAAYPDARRPLAGPSDPAAGHFAAEARLAISFGINAFLWCWYWDGGSLLLNTELDTFLSSELPPGFQYALLWVNKRPYMRLPLEAPPAPSDVRSRLILTSETDFEAMIAHLIARHWHRKRYIRIDGKPLLPIFLVEPLIRQLGATRLARLLEHGSAMARDAGLDGVYYVACIHQLHPNRAWLNRAGLGRLAGTADLAAIGFSAVTTYVFLPEWEDYCVQSYSRLVDRRIAQWPGFVDQFRLPFWPSVSPGWDARTRGTPQDAPPCGHPWFPVVHDETPREFERLLDAWMTFAGSRGDVGILPIASWNEWTEGHAIAPCTRHGDGMLRALAGMLGRFSDDGIRSPAAAAPGGVVSPA